MVLLKCSLCPRWGESSFLCAPATRGSTWCPGCVNGLSGCEQEARVWGRPEPSENLKKSVESSGGWAMQAATELTPGCRRP